MEFLTYKKFYEKDNVDALAKILNDNAIEYELAEDRESLDSLYGDKQFSRQYFIKIKQADFAKADSIISRMTESGLDTVDKDHYLFGFNDEELFEILGKPDEWSELDYHLAKKILKERGKEINSETLSILKRQRIKELAKPEERQSRWILAGYLFAFLGGVFGFFIGLHLSTFKKTLPDGQRVYGHTQEDRRSGTRIMIISIAMSIIWLVIKIMNQREY
jgi:hypothetical protein